MRENPRHRVPATGEISFAPELEIEEDRLCWAGPTTLEIAGEPAVEVSAQRLREWNKSLR
jgi:hypothetical protein